MSEPLLTKRLHVSGITSAITPADLERRLSSFGKVKAMDGFGLRNILGDPKNFGFVTIEIRAKELAKCLNMLSGSTWKGSKLRISEAKPDFRERLAKINSQPLGPVRPQRIHCRHYGYPSSTLPLTPLSATAAASTPGWIVTPSGRVVRPMRMRPERPLEPTRSKLSASKIKGVNGKVKKRVKPPPLRARRCLIDPTKWDSVYLKGAFLNAVSVPFPLSNEPPSDTKHDALDEDEDETDEDTTDSNASQTEVAPSPPSFQLDQECAHTILSSQQSQGASLAASSQVHEITESIDVRGEAQAALAILGKIFEDKEDWEGRESVEEMENFEGTEPRKREIQADGEDDIGTVPRGFRVSERSKVKIKGGEKLLGEAIRFSHEDIMATHDANVEMETDSSTNIKASTEAQTNLKVLFAPREEASFSLLNHLELELDPDLELDAGLLGISVPSDPSYENRHLHEPNFPKSYVTRNPGRTSNAKAQSRLTLDPSLPLFFPRADSLPHPCTPSSDASASISRPGTSSCILFPSVPGSHRLSQSITFTRSPQNTPERIRDMWERDKSSLTYEWKKAWREARGNKRGRAGIGGEIGGGY